VWPVGEHAQAVAHPARRARQVDDQGLPGHTAHTARQHRRRNLRQARQADGLGQAGNHVVEQRDGLVGRAVAGRDARATRGDDDVAPVVKRLAQGLPHRLPVGDHLWLGGRIPLLPKPFSNYRPAAVVVPPGRGAGRGDDDSGGSGVHHRSHVPVLPPSLRSTRMSSMCAAGSTALIMSYSVSPATLTAVSASISTPVRSVLRTVATISMSDSPTVKSMSTPVSASWWHSGTSSLVRLAARMPATRAVASASPWGRAPVDIRSTIGDEVRNAP